MLARSSMRGLRRHAAFTLLELIMVLALFALAATLIIGGGAAMLRESDEASVEQKTLAAIAKARHEAVASDHQIELRYNEKTRLLDWGSGQVTLAGKDELRLLPPKQISAMLLGGRVVERPIALVRFYADGTCDPFRLEIVQDGTSRIVSIDPWTCTALAPSPATGGNVR